MLDERSRQAIQRAANILISTVPWTESRKGWDYWRDVYQELKRIAETGEP